jgi:AcrR family transcriptional regulator
VRLFNERGYDATSMEDLSRALGITKSAIYHHVSSKEELRRLATGRALDRLFSVAAAVEVLPGRAIDRLERLVRGSVAVLVAQLPFVTLLLRVHGNTPTEREALARRRDLQARVRRPQEVTPARIRAGLRTSIASICSSVTPWSRR